MIKAKIIVDDKFVYVNSDLISALDDKVCFFAGTNQVAEGAIVVNSKKNTIKYTSWRKNRLQVVEREITPDLQVYMFVRECNCGSGEFWVHCCGIEGDIRYCG